MANRKVKERLKTEERKPLTLKNLSQLLGIFKFLLPYKIRFFTGLFLLIVSSLLLLSFPFLTGKLVDAADGRNNWITNDINLIAAALIAALFLQSIVSFFRVYLFAFVNEKAMADIRYRLYENMIGLPMSFFDKRRAGELISRITSDVSMLQNTFSVTLAEFVRQGATLIVGGVILFILTPKLTWFMVGVFPIAIIVGLLFGKYIRKLSKRTQDELAGANIIVEETLQAINTVKAFTSEAFEVNRYKGALNKVIKIALHSAKFRGAFISFIIFILLGAIVAVMWYGATLVQSGAMSIGDLLSFVLYTTFIGGSIAGLGDIYTQIQKSIGASERVQEIIGKHPEINLRTTKKKLTLKGKINFDDVHFSYPTRKNVDALKGIALEILPGEKAALVGHSGAGKSTMVQLLMRFYDVKSGSIKIDGKDIREFDLLDYRRHVGIVPQEVILFGGSIRENIAYGKPDAGDDEIREAACQANALEFIERLPDGFDTTVGDRGVKLSGGQRQRIAIARAILKDPAILILDEATSSLDAESERLVQEALDQLMASRTTIIIAHRLATIRKVDKIYVINEGQIAESGTHDELLSREGDYSALIKLQMELN